MIEGAKDWHKEESTRVLSLQVSVPVSTSLAIGLFTGLLGASLGLGGGLVLLPFWISYGVPVKTAGATCSMIILLKSMASMGQVVQEEHYQVCLLYVLAGLSLISCSWGLSVIRRRWGQKAGDSGVKAGLIVLFLTLIAYTVILLRETYGSHARRFMRWGKVCAAH